MPTIMLIDDDPHLLRALGDRLEYEGFDLVRATSAEDAFEICKEKTPDLIVLDLKMPGIGGQGFLNEVRSRLPGNPPILVCTAHPDGVTSTTDANIVGVLIKPCPERLLAERIRAALVNSGGSVAGTAPSAHVLLGENDAGFAGRVKDLLGEAGHRTTVVGDGLAVLEHAAKSIPDLIILKEALPTVRGSSVVPLIAVMPSTRNVPVLIYAPQYSMKPDSPNGSAHGVRRYLEATHPRQLFDAAQRELALRQVPA